ncbi:MAG: terminase small subunit [Ruminococcaceae bacterium]|nr:terminase small subunit [Oscillospiraceae bacterium]
MNEKQKRFAEYYAQNPNATEAAKAAGYSEHTARSQGQRLLTNVDIQKYIAELQEAAAASRIASISEVKTFWSETMRSNSERMTDRIKASNLLAKSAGVFLPPAPKTEEPHKAPEEDYEDVMFYDDRSEIYEDENKALIWLPRKKTEGECQAADETNNEGE